MVKKTEPELAAVESETKIEYNNHAELAYLKYHKKEGDGWDVPEHVNRWERKFLEEADTDKGPIVRTITKIIRQRDRLGKEWLTWRENWEGVNYLGNPLRTVGDHLEGVYEEVQAVNKINEKGKIVGKEPKGFKRVFYIPWDKNTLDQILEKANRHRDEIIYLVKITDTLRDETFSYEQFANLSFQELMGLSRQVGGPRMTPYVSK